MAVWLGNTDSFDGRVGSNKTDAQRIIRYRMLFADFIPVEMLDQIRECTNKSWVLGTSKFKAQIEAAANRRIESLGWGGDRKSKKVKNQRV
jgi:putative transposase